MRTIDIIGEKFGRLTALRRVEDKIDPSGRKRQQYECVCDCGNTVVVTKERLRSGFTKSCGCLRKEKTSNMFFKDISGQQFGYLTALDVSYSNYMGTFWRCICKCGKEVIVNSSNLRAGNTKSCGCYMNELTTAREKAEIKGQHFGRLTAIECVGQNDHKNYLWKCKCQCGSVIVVPATRLIIGETQSCGCLTSKGEEEIAKYLTSQMIKFERQYVFSDLKLNGLLKFDFALFGQNNEVSLIEYQGIQHYVPQKTNFGLLQRETTDELKREYCKAHNIQLFEIRYDENIHERMNEIIEHVNPVPSTQETA